MGAKLVRIIEVVTEKGGYNARSVLAERTGISMKKAEEMPDTAEIIESFKNMAAEIVDQVRTHPTMFYNK